MPISRRRRSRSRRRRGGQSCSVDKGTSQESKKMCQSYGGKWEEEDDDPFADAMNNLGDTGFGGARRRRRRRKSRRKSRKKSRKSRRKKRRSRRRRRRR